MHEGPPPFREAEDALPHAAGRDDRSTRPERRRRLHGRHDRLGHGDDRNRQVRALRGEAVLRHRRCRGHRGSHQRVYQDEQRGAGCQEVHHDDCGRMYLLSRRRAGSPAVLRHQQLSHARNAR